MNWKPPQVEHPPTPERCQPSIDLVQDLRMDAEMLKDGHQENLTKLWHSDVVKNAAANALLAADTIASLKADNEGLRKALGEIARQMLVPELIEEFGEEYVGDFEGAYEAIIKIARAALPQSSGVARAEK
jgi:hypothetical protein